VKINGKLKSHYSYKTLKAMLLRNILYRWITIFTTNNQRASSQT